MASSTQRPGTPRGAGSQHGAGAQRGSSGADTHSRVGGAATVQPADLIGWGGDRVERATKLPSVRLAPRDDLAGLARVAPLLRAARDLDEWVAGQHSVDAASELEPSTTAVAASELDLAPREVVAAWQVVLAARSATGQERAQPEKSKPEKIKPGSGLAGVLGHGSSEAVLNVWDTALAVILASEELDGIATALYTVGGPVGIDGLFDAYTSAAGTGTSDRRAAAPEAAGGESDAGGSSDPDRSSSVGGSSDGGGSVRDHSAALSLALETLADLAVVELGTEESDGSLTVALSPLGTWGVHRRLRAQGWHVPVLGAAAKYDASGLLAALADCDAEDGEAEITTWLAARDAATAAAELIAAAAAGSPGQRGAAFAVLDRVGLAALNEVKQAQSDPLLRAHAAVWLLEHGEDVHLDPGDRTWLLVDLGAGLLEEANPADVVAELLPSLPPEDQAEIVSGLWQVNHPGVTDLLTALSDHHPDPSVARAARKAAFKARSPAASTD